MALSGSQWHDGAHCRQRPSLPAPPVAAHFGASTSALSLGLVSALGQDVGHVVTRVLQGIYTWLDDSWFQIQCLLDRR